MTAPRGGALYTPEMLSLAVSLAEYPLDPASPHKGAARSRVCGSEVEIGCALDESERICALGLRVTACAFGQSAAALFAKSARGRDAASLTRAQSAIEDWLAGAGLLPDWPGIEILGPALAHSARHPAILLPWKAALDALCKAEAAR